MTPGLTASTMPTAGRSRPICAITPSRDYRRGNGGSTSCLRRSASSCRLSLDPGDAQHVGGAGRAEGHASGDDNALPLLAEILALRCARCMRHHLVEVTHIVSVDAVE